LEAVTPLDYKRERTFRFPSPRLSSIDRSQLVFRTVDVEKMIDDDHSARSIWETIGRLDLSLYRAKIAAVEGRAGRDHISAAAHKFMVVCI
jgi:hypothetical protein